MPFRGTRALIKHLISDQFDDAERVHANESVKLLFRRSMPSFYCLATCSYQFAVSLMSEIPNSISGEEKTVSEVI